MPQQQPKYTLDRVVRMVLTTVTIVALILLLRYLSDVLVPFAAAVVLAYLLNPIVSALDRRTGRRGLAVGLTLAGVGVIAAAGVAILVPLVVSQVGRFRDNLQSLRADIARQANVTSINDDERIVPSLDSASPNADDLEAGLDRSPEKSALGFKEFQEGWRRYRERADELGRSERLALLMSSIKGTWLGDAFTYGANYVQSDEFKGLLIETGKKMIAGGWSVLTLSLNFLLGLTVLIIVLLYLVFLLLDYPRYAQTWRTFLPPTYREPIVDFLEQFSVVMRRYFRGQALIAISMAVLFAVGFSIINLPMALLFGLFVGLLNMVPYLQTVGLVPAALLAGMRAIETDSSFLLSIGLVLLVFALAQIIQDVLLTPRIMGKATGLSPVAILLGVFVWGKLLGFLGLILAIPLTCLGIASYRRYILSRGDACVTDGQQD